MQKLDETVINDIKNTLIQAENAIKEMNNKKKFMLFALLCAFIFFIITIYQQFVYIQQNHLNFLQVLALGIIDGVLGFFILKVFKLYKNLTIEIKDMSSKLLYLKDLFDKVDQRTETTSSNDIEETPSPPSIMQ